MATELYKTVFAVKQSTDNLAIENVEKGKYDEPSVVFNEFPRARFTISDPSGVILNSVLTNGKEIEIRRGVNGSTGERRFLGIIEDVEGLEDENGGHPTVHCVHKGYKMLQQHLCDTYDYDEDGDASTTRDGVTVNPWNYFIFRKAGGDLDVRGDVLPIDGVTFDDVVKCLIGTKFVHQVDFVDNRYLLASQIYLSTNKVQVYRDGPSSDLRPKLQRVRNATSGYAAGQAVETIPLENGSPDVDAMGTVSSVTVTLIGEALNGNPTVAVCRNARDGTRQYTAGKTGASTNILEDDAVTDTSLDRWAFTFSGADWPGTGSLNSLGVKITFPGSSGDATTTKIHYMKVSCVTASDTGLSEGTIDAYDGPTSLRDDIDPSDWVETDLSEFTRLEAGEKLRKQTESDAAVNVSPHWDLWIDANLAVHFKERRGSDITNHDYSFKNGNLLKVKQEYVGAELAYQTIAYGPGSGTAQTRIVSKEEYSAGGLYDVNRDPNGGTALYGQLPRVMKFVDENEKSPVSLYRKARAFHKLHRDPIENVQVSLEPEFIRFFDVGDRITPKNLRTRTNGLKRVIKLSRSWDGGDFEGLDIQLGSPLDDLSRVVGNSKSNHETLVIRPGGSQSTMGVSGNGINCTKDRYGVFAFGIHEGQAVDRVFLKMTTVPWQITARGAAATTSDSGGGHTTAAGGGHTSTSGGGQTTTGGSIGADDHYHRMTASLAAVGAETFTDKIMTIYSSPAIGDMKIKVAHVDGTSTDARDLSHTLLGGSTGHQHSVAAHTHEVANHTHVVSNHQHTIPASTPEFGIWQFDGDAGTGTGNPIYGSGIQVAIDPTVNAQGLPSAFSTDRHPTIFGSGTTPQTIELDVTGYLDVDANGIIKTGEHKVFFLVTGAQTSNAQGLAAIMVTPILKYRPVA